MCCRPGWESCIENHPGIPYLDKYATIIGLWVGPVLFINPGAIHHHTREYVFFSPRSLPNYRQYTRVCKRCHHICLGGIIKWEFGISIDFLQRMTSLCLRRFAAQLHSDHMLVLKVTPGDDIHLYKLMYYPPEVRSMKYCRLGVFIGQYSFLVDSFTIGNSKYINSEYI